MRKSVGWVRLAILVLLLMEVLLACGCEKRTGEQITPTDLGIPLLLQYPNVDANNIRSRRSEDTVIHDGRLYVGCGDYSANMGPVKVYSMGLADKKWQASETELADEQIKRFVILDGKLCITGTDPAGDDWTLGNYYSLEGGEWVTHRELPSGIHCFDALEFEGKTFFGLGVNGGDFPVVVTEGEGYLAVPFVRDGVEVNTAESEYVRVYNLTVFEGQLYAFLTLGNPDQMDYSVYRYDGQQFCYFATPPQVFVRGYDLYHNVGFGGMNTFISGYCYFTTEDMKDFRPRRVGDSDLACDMEIIDGTLYVLAYRTLADGSYEVGMYSTEDGKTFTKLFYFEYSIPANSFAYADGVFYLSMGRYYDAESHDVGRVLAVDYMIQ